jgi:hypothetical protein
MPRTKGKVKIAPASDQHAPARLQDGTGLEDRISTTIIEGFLAPISERVTIIESVVGGLTLDRGVVYELDVPLQRGATGGTVVVDLPLPVEADAIDLPLLVNQAPRGDVDEGGIIAFTGKVIASQKVRLHWHSGNPAPATVKVVYLIA